jgi:hypothetical protein
MRDMGDGDEHGQVHLTATLILVALVVAGIWIWKRLPPDVQDWVVEQAVPLAASGTVIVWVFWRLVRGVYRQRTVRQARARLVAQFQRETSLEKRFELACKLVELNNYRPEGLEAIRPELFAVFSRMLETAVGDKQHRIRGMAASYLGVVQDAAAVPLLMKALDDDHWWVRSQAALGLGRLRAKEAKAKLEYMAKEDWDQTVRSRCREALERLE